MDRHGDLAFLLDPVAGTLTDTRVFDPFGDAVASTGTTNQTLGFQADYTDPASGEVWMGARWYSGTDAAFRSRDTVFGELATPISLNRYTYAYANPLTYWDPDGRTPVVDGAGAAILGFEDDGTPIREQVSEDRVERHNERVAESTWRVEIEAYYRNLYESTNPTPRTATEIVRPTLLDRFRGVLDEVLGDWIGSSPSWAGAGAVSFADRVEHTVKPNDPRGIRYRDLPKGSFARQFRQKLFGPNAKTALGRIRVWRGLSKSLSVVAVGIDAHESWNMYSDKPLLVRGTATAVRSGVSFAGGVKGAIAFGSLGVSAGTVCGPYAIACSTVGGVTFGAFGAVAGSGTARWLWDKSIGRWL